MTSLFTFLLKCKFKFQDRDQTPEQDMQVKYQVRDQCELAPQARQGSTINPRKQVNASFSDVDRAKQTGSSSDPIRSSRK